MEIEYEGGERRNMRQHSQLGFQEGQKAQQTQSEEVTAETSHTDEHQDSDWRFYRPRKAKPKENVK